MSAGENSELYLWSIASGAILQRFTGHSGAVTRLAFSRAGDRLLSAGADGTAKYWRLDSPTAIARLQLPYTDRTHLDALGFSSTSGLLVVDVNGGNSSEDHKCYVYNLNTSSTSQPEPANILNDCFVLGKRINPFQDGLVYVNFVPDLDHNPGLAMYEQSVLLYQTPATGAKAINATTIANPETLPRAVIPSGPDQILVISCNCAPPVGLRGDNIWYYDVVDLTTQTSVLHMKMPEPLLATLDATRKMIDSLPQAVTPDGQQFILSQEANLFVIDIQSGQILREVSLQGTVNDANLSPDGQRLVTAGQDGTTIIWDYETLTPLLVLRGHTGGVTQARFVNKGQTIITAGMDGTIRFWEADSGRVTRLIQDHTDTVGFMAVSDDEQTLITAGQDMNIYVYNIGQNLLEQASKRLTRGDLTEEECAKYLSRTGCKLELLDTPK